MNAGAPALFFCLATGAAMGILFLAFKGARLLLGAGKALTFCLDAVFCCLCGVVVFLCALALDHGRFRLFQAVFQGIGAWAAVAALDPFVGGLARVLKKIFRRIRGAFRRAGGFLGSHLPVRGAKKGDRKGKPRKNRKKSKKRA